VALGPLPMTYYRHSPLALILLIRIKGADTLTIRVKTGKMYISVPTILYLGKMNNLGTKEINYGSTMRTHR